DRSTPEISAPTAGVTSLIVRGMVWSPGVIFSKCGVARCSFARTGAKKAKRHSRVIALLHLSCPCAQPRSTAMKNLCRSILAGGLAALAFCGAAHAQANQVRFARQL